MPESTPSGWELRPQSGQHGVDHRIHGLMVLTLRCFVVHIHQIEAHLRDHSTEAVDYVLGIDGPQRTPFPVWPQNGIPRCPKTQSNSQYHKRN